MLFVLNKGVRFKILERDIDAQAMFCNDFFHLSLQKLKSLHASSLPLVTKQSLVILTLFAVCKYVTFIEILYYVYAYAPLEPILPFSDY